jgi:hypothetical protein
MLAHLAAGPAVGRNAQYRSLAFVFGEYDMGNF